MRGIPSYPDKLWSEIEGDIENVNGRPVITTIRAKYHLKLPPGKREAAQRVLQFHVDKCPAALSVKPAIAIEWSCEFEEDEAQ